MNSRDHARRLIAAISLLLVVLAGCQSKQEPTNTTEQLTAFATRYAAAWSGSDPVAFATFYTENGSLRINDGEPAVGRDAIAQMAHGFMTAFPDMIVRLVELRQTDRHVEFHWHWTGTNTGPGGTGNAVDLRGYEQWTFDQDGLILESLGHLDDAEYQRQLHADAAQPEIIEIFACSDLCLEPVETYMRRVYQGVTDRDECLSLGGRPFSVTGWGTQHYCAVVDTDTNGQPKSN